MSKKWYEADEPYEQPLVVALPKQPDWDTATPSFRRALLDEIDAVYNAYRARPRNKGPR